MESELYDKLQEDLRTKFYEITFWDKFKGDGILRMKLLNQWDFNIDLKFYLEGFEFYGYDYILVCVIKQIETFWMGIIRKPR